MKIALVAALAENNAIGENNKLLWNLPADMKHFRTLTRGHPVIMGRETYESIGRPLPERTNIVITRNQNYAADGCLLATSFEEALQKARESDLVFVIGGAQIYKLALPHADIMYLTRVHAQLKADTFFPEFDEEEWSVSNKEHHSKDESNQYNYTFITYERVVEPSKRK